MLEKTNKATVMSKESDKHKQKLQAEVAKLNAKIKVITKCIIFFLYLKRFSFRRIMDMYEYVESIRRIRNEME